SDGFSLADSGGMVSNDELQPITSRAIRSGILIYSLDAKRLQPAMISAENSGAAVARAYGSQSYKENTSLSSVVDIVTNAELGVGDIEIGLRDLAASTGGEAFFGANDLNSRLQKALDNNRAYYVLSYYPADDEAPRKLRKITVHVKDRPDYEVRAQKGYLPTELARKEEKENSLTPQQKLSRAMASPLPLTAIGVSISA